MTTSSTHDQVEGKVHEIKGAIKEKVGEITKNPTLQDQGTAERIQGTIEKKIGEIKQVLEK